MDNTWTELYHFWSRLWDSRSTFVHAVILLNVHYIRLMHFLPLNTLELLVPCQESSKISCFYLQGHKYW